MSSASGNNTSKANTTAPVEIKNKSKTANKTANVTEYPTTAKVVQERLSNISH